ncbi:hypothetical protein Ccrd_015675 [Cynara cardunculus var. scolymus]|uniref:Helicase ATP-binding domain-containing protein n=1 Tax=Cynara cardunculus var. scolymus TaxID=59895 RepID=A0A118K3J0_CYNCS|nr:hypothetical protein Ccrd_015675 [Cynara cardunculus var. scolymus]
MPTYKIRDINVEFPFEAYDCQLVYMEKVIQSLQERSNALLESPTGTGKTLCLLCATLAWRKSLGDFSTGKSVKRVQDPGNKHSEDSSSQTESSKLPTIIYTSRTHSQIRQVVQELKRTVYRPKMVVLGSREQLCIHPDVSLLHGKTQTNACHFLCQKRTKRYCSHFPRVSEFVKNNPGLGDEPIDIEDLVNIGKSSGPKALTPHSKCRCPYYMSRELHKVVDILFAPYNYLIDPGNRKSLSIEWDNSVLIFDEAHNLEGICADAASFDLPSGLLTSCISEAQNCVDLAVARRDESNDKSYNPDNFAILRGILSFVYDRNERILLFFSPALLLKLEKRIAEVPIDSKELGFTKPGPYIYELLGDLNITHKTANMLLDTIEEATVLLEEDAKTTASQKTKGTVCRLESIGDILKLIFKDDGNAHAKHYRVSLDLVHVQEVEASSSDAFKGKQESTSVAFGDAGKASRIFSWWCFNPGVAMEEFSRRGVRSIVLTSGTLSPMDSFAEELKLAFPVRLENPHVISSNQLWAGIVPVGPSGHPFNSSYRTRDSAEYKLNLGNSIGKYGDFYEQTNYQLAHVISLVLLATFLHIDFPEAMDPHCMIAHDKCTNTCLLVLSDKLAPCFQSVTSTNSSTIWERICKHKLPVVEPRQSSLFPQAIDDYMAKLRDTSSTGAVFFAVCRGKVSEGLDFADHAGRAVIVTGIPFALRNDPKVRLKREFLDQQVSQRKGSKEKSGIANKHHGLLIKLLDVLFDIVMIMGQSFFVMKGSCYSKFGDVVFTLTRFFRDAAITCPKKQKLTQIEESAADKCCSVGSSSMADVKRGSLSCKLSEILPANRSNISLNTQKQRPILKHTNNQLSEEKLFPGKAHVQGVKPEVVDLAGDALLDEESSSQLTAPYFLKKRRLGNAKHDSLLQRCESSYDGTNESIPHGKFSSSPQYVKSGNKEVVQECSTLQVKNEMATQKRSTEFVSSETRSAKSTCSPCDDEEKKGSTFLIQVREKLSDGEYKEFVGFMKALKSKAMKIGHI